MSQFELEDLEMNEAEETRPAAEPPADPVDLPLRRIRARWAKREALRYTGHLDMQLVWERTLRRAGLPLAYSKGFRPNPRLHLAAALPLGFLSCGEITDFWLEQAGSPDLDALAAQIQAAAPPGLEILGVEAVPLSEPALQTQVRAAEYIATALDLIDLAGLARSVETLLEAPSILCHRRGKKRHGQPYDLRPLIECLETGPAEPPVLRMRLTAREGATGRPEEVLKALGHDPASFRVERLALILAQDGQSDDLLGKLEP